MVKLVDFKVHVSDLKAREKEGYGKLDVRIEAEELLTEEKFKVVSWAFEKTDKENKQATKADSATFKTFKENMEILVAGKRATVKNKAEREKLEGEKKKVENDKSEANLMLGIFKAKAIEYQGKVGIVDREILLLESELQFTPPSALTVARKYEVLGVVSGLEMKKEDDSTALALYNDAAYTVEGQINNNKNIFDR